MASVRLAPPSAYLRVPQTFTTYLAAQKGAGSVSKLSLAIVLISFLLELKIKFKSNFTFQEEKDVLIQIHKAIPLSIHSVLGSSWPVNFKEKIKVQYVVSAFSKLMGI